MTVLSNTNRTAITTADIQTEAKRKLEVLRAFMAEFGDAVSLAELTTDELRIASRTPPAYLRLGAVVAETQPLPGYPPNAAHLMRIAAEADDAMLDRLFDLIGEDHILFSSDFPHGEGRENAALEILERKDLSAEQKKKLLYDNTVRFFGEP